MPSLLTCPHCKAEIKIFGFFFRGEMDKTKHLVRCNDCDKDFEPPKPILLPQGPVAEDDTGAGQRIIDNQNN